ncbi:MAG: cytochrome b/b6 domain-containing protein [Bacillota bacterium]
MSIFNKLKKPRHTLPVRLFHWVYAPAVLAGIISGYYIANPNRKLGFKDMESARKTHFLAQYMLIFSFLGRVYYSYVTKNYKEIIPGKKDLKEAPKYMKYQLFLSDKKPKYLKYNPFQKTVFTLFAFLIPVQIISGLALYFTDKFKQATGAVGGLNPMRQVHYLVSLAVTSLTLGHIYFALTDSLKRLKSIFTGYR